MAKAKNPVEKKAPAKKKAPKKAQSVSSPSYKRSKRGATSN